MKQLAEITAYIDNAIFEDEELEEIQNEYDLTNPAHIARLVDKYNKPGSEFSTTVVSMLATRDRKPATIPKEDIKRVYLALKNRDENPRGAFDRAGRFYATDNELMDVRAPSSRYPHSQMNAARTAKFLRALAEKYKCVTLEDLEVVAFS